LVLSRLLFNLLLRNVDRVLKTQPTLDLNIEEFNNFIWSMVMALVAEASILVRAVVGLIAREEAGCFKLVLVEQIEMRRAVVDDFFA
jgi:hypothetical protein